ncbi:putative secreted protein (Por secretion system target) [Flavobacterium endophyticum]|uniref:Putative secreted protein (Por secretion system target) n=1 Tax=Flavobacterium endophyticum TaxID=1540163 RepID=A0A495MKQ2_9FLAO|nr:T9SS type A sorting domain-containing protein [Flavobacterium endophyticum]RKS26527.1 putative secreted protein (Por secretion system target) [Flavobacterium endophyticum]
MKNLLLVAALLLSNLFYGQLPVWVNSFDSADDMAGWTFHDLNANGNKWMQGPNIYYNGTSLAYGESGVLRFSISNVPSGNATGFATENDWVISPEIDLTSASGTITLAAYIGRQRTTHVSLGRYVYIYVSTPEKQVPELSDFQALAVDADGNQVNYPYEMVAGQGATPFPKDLTEFAESLEDISVFAGKKIYIGLWSNRISSGTTGGRNVQNINIDEIGIYATALGTKDIQNGAATKILQNPAASELVLELNPALAPEQTTVTIYTMLGQKVMAMPYAARTDVASLANGTYLITITDGTTVDRLKFIKK